MSVGVPVVMAIVAFVLPTDAPMMETKLVRDDPLILGALVIVVVFEVGTVMQFGVVTAKFVIVLPPVTKLNAPPLLLAEIVTVA